MASSLLGAALLLGVYVDNGGSINPWDSEISAWVKSIRSPAIDPAMLTATYLCSWPVILAGGSLAIGFFLLWREWLWALAVVISLAANTLVNTVLKGIVHRARPDQAGALLPAQGVSFPSGHTFSAFAFYGLLAVVVSTSKASASFQRANGAAIGVLIVLVSFSRVYVGAHWPSDVLESWLLGAALLVAAGDLAKAHPPNFTPRPWFPGRTPNASILLLGSIWLVLVVGYALVYPITTSAGALGE